MPKKAASPNLAFAVAQLRKNPKTSFAALRAAGQKRGLTIVPIVYGRAKLALGLSKPGVANTGSEEASPSAEGGLASASDTSGVDRIESAEDAHARPTRANHRPSGRSHGASVMKRRPRRISPAPEQASSGPIDLHQLVEAVQLAEEMKDALLKIQEIIGALNLNAGAAPSRDTGNGNPARRRNRPRP